MHHGDICSFPLDGKVSKRSSRQNAGTFLVKPRSPNHTLAAKARFFDLFQKLERKLYILYLISNLFYCSITSKLLRITSILSAITSKLRAITSKLSVIISKLWGVTSKLWGIISKLSGITSKLLGITYKLWEKTFNLLEICRCDAALSHVCLWCSTTISPRCGFALCRG